MVQKLERDSQLFFTTHNTDILDMNFPKHSYNFLRKEIFGDECFISVVNAGAYAILKHSIELCQGGNGGNIQCIEPAFLECLEMPFYLAFVM